jgi:putative aldouronate transport system permease protein
MSSKTNDVHKKKGKTKLKQVISFAPIYLMMLPGLIYFFINNYMPMPGTIIAFKTYSAKLGIFKSPWVGLKNFRYLFATDDAWVITRNTILYNLSFIIVNTVLAIIIAIMLSEMKSKKFKKFSQSVLLLPYLISWVIVSYLAYAFLSGESGFFNMTIMPLLGKNQSAGILTVVCGPRLSYLPMPGKQLVTAA